MSKKKNSRATCSLAPNMTNLVMLGGHGSRLHYLTRHDLFHHERAKPAVSFSSKYRIVDFIMSNLLNSGCKHVSALLQYGAQPMTNYLSKGWGREFGTFDYVPPSQRTLGNFYQGTADAVRQSLWQLREHESDIVGIWAGDHITKFDVNPFLHCHVESPSRFTVAVMPVPISRAYQFGVVVVDDSGKVIGFQEKPGSDENPDVVPVSMPGNPDMVLASLGNYIVYRDYLIEILNDDQTMHDFGGEIIPAIIAGGDVYAYDMSSMILPGDEQFYWEDVGTLRDYHNLHMKMLDPVPPVNLRNRDWKIRFLADDYDPFRSIGKKNQIDSTMLSGGCLIEGSHTNFTVVGREGVITESNVDQSILFDNVRVDRGCDLHRVIIDKNVHIPPRTTIGRDHKEDEARGFHVDESGIITVPRYYKFDQT